MNPKHTTITMHEVNVTIEPSEKYNVVICGESEFDELPETEEEYIEQSQYHEASNAYLKTIEQGPTVEETSVSNGSDTGDTGGDELETLSWDLFSVSSDPDLVAKMATYFDGMEPDDPTDEIRAKLRLLDCEVYANAQIAARAELRE